MDQRESISLMASAASPYYLHHFHNSNPNPSVTTTAAAAEEPPPVVRRKRGRPRKYGHDGGASLPNNTTTNNNNSNPRQAQKWRHVSSSSSSSSSSMFSGAGTTMAPHVIRINAGEDIKRRIVSVLHGRRAVVLLSAIGSISAASIRSSSSTGSVTYEGHFDMVNLSGSYINDPADGLSGGLNVTFAGSDGRLIGGPVDGLLIAATPVQVIVGVLVPSSSSSAKPKAKDNYSSEGGFTESQNLAPWQS